jgi:hypothetical protein
VTGDKAGGDQPSSGQHEPPVLRAPVPALPGDLGLPADEADMSGGVKVLGEGLAGASVAVQDRDIKLIFDADEVPLVVEEAREVLGTQVLLVVCEVAQGSRGNVERFTGPKARFSAPQSWRRLNRRPWSRRPRRLPAQAIPDMRHGVSAGGSGQ